MVPDHGARATCEPLIADPRLRKLSFTGSTPVGSPARPGAERVLRVSLELGGNAPFVVFADADLDAAVDGAMVAKFRNVGQACTAANRFIVRGGGRRVRASAVGRVRDARVGSGLDEGTTIGPLIDERAVDKVRDLVRDAVERGATVRSRAASVDGPGTYWAPTVLSDVRPGSEILRAEVFGPVLAVSTFRDEAEAVRLANDTEYGLVAYAYTRDLARAQRLAETLETGMLGLDVGVVSNAGAPVRRRQGVRPRTRGRRRGHPRVPRDGLPHDPRPVRRRVGAGGALVTPLPCASAWWATASPGACSTPPSSPPTRPTSSPPSSRATPTAATRSVPPTRARRSSPRPPTWPRWGSTSSWWRRRTPRTPTWRRRRSAPGPPSWSTSRSRPAPPQARGLVELAESLERPLTVYQNRRWDGDFLTATRLVASGVLGDVHTFESRFEPWKTANRAGWKASAGAEEGGGILFDLGPHLVDQALRLFGPAIDVHAELATRRPGSAADDDAFVSLLHEGGVRSRLWMSHVAAQPAPRLRVLGSAGAYVVSGLDPQEAQLAAGGSPRDEGYGLADPALAGTVGIGADVRREPTDRGTYPTFYATLATALTEGGPLPVDPRDAVAALEVIERARASAG